MKLSIIIPVYNAEKYLQKCLESILHQGLQHDDYEVLLINDGSTDGSLTVAEKFRYQFKNFTIINQDNRGEAASRNMGLQVAKGDYITFLDSDDYYEHDCLQGALLEIEQQELDMLYLRLKQVDEAGSFIKYIFDLQTDGEVLSGLTHERRPYPATVYKRTLIADIQFPSSVLVGTDSVFNAIVQSRAERVSFTRKAIYNYTYRADSLSKQGYSEKAFQGFITAIGDLRTFQAKNFSENDVAISYFDNMYTVFVTRILDLNIIPQWNRKNYNELLNVLEELNLMYILDRLSTKYAYVGTSFRKFKFYQQYLGFKSTIYQLLHRA